MENRRASLLRFLLGLLLLALAVLRDGTYAQAEPSRLQVLPVLFVPSDNAEIYEGGRVAAFRKASREHLVAAQSHYRTLLVTDTFQIAAGDALVYAARHP